jgi:hypothetical protein
MALHFGGKLALAELFFEQTANSDEQCPYIPQGHTSSCNKIGIAFMR